MTNETKAREYWKNGGYDKGAIVCMTELMDEIERLNNVIPMAMGMLSAESEAWKYLQQALKEQSK